MRIFTLGFAGKSAEHFFETLKRNRIEKLVDIRLRNNSQMAGFTKKNDLPYFLKEICGIEYQHRIELAPPPELLDAYRDKGERISWAEYEIRFQKILSDRALETLFKPKDFEIPTVLLCSESKAEHCHRRLVAEYWASRWNNVDIVHL